MGKWPGQFANHIGDLLEIWQEGLLIYTENQLDAIKDALFKFQQKNDTKAAVIVSLTYLSGQVCTVVQCHYRFKLTHGRYCRQPSYFMMCPLLRKYSTIS